MKKNILITGLPRSGKTTLLKKVIANFENKVGFVTNEIREKGKRVGFEIETNFGEKSTLASINFKTNLKVSRYFVNIDKLDKIIPSITKFTDKDLLYLDEIGQMELFSESFKQLALTYLNSSNICITTISKIYDDDFIKKIKNRNDIILIEITEEKRDIMKKFIQELIRKIQKAQRYVKEPNRFKITKDSMTIASEHGIRRLKKNNNYWICDCEFFKENNICSHTIALEEVLKLSNVKPFRLPKSNKVMT